MLRRILARREMHRNPALGQNGRAVDRQRYNGDMDGRDAWTNQTGAADGLVYDDFIAQAGSSYTITGVFSNDAMFTACADSTAYWEIRWGVSASNSGTLLDSGDVVDFALHINGENRRLD